MKAVVIAEPSGASGLRIQDVPDPVPGRGQLLVDVKAVGLNRADLLQSMGLYPPPPGVTEIMGLEYCGVVAKAAGAFKKGERVMGLVPGGAFAEQVVVEAAHTLKAPKELSDTEAAGVVEAFMTAYDAIWLQAGAKKGQRLLIHAVGSGVGSAAVQLAKAFGLESVGTSRTQSKLDAAVYLGLDVPLLVGDPPDFASKAEQPDLCLDLVGGNYFAETISAMAPRGTIMVVGLTAGATADTPLFQILGKRLRIIGTTLRSRADKERTFVTRRFARDVVPLFKKKKLKAVVTQLKPMSEVAKAFEQLANNETFGKTVLTW
jgi:putative PIG3 family NAD(P)H quinone oxidoreductase